MLNLHKLTLCPEIFNIFIYAIVLRACVFVEWKVFSKG